MDDMELLCKFEDCSLPHEEWTHRSHVKVAYLHLVRDPFDVALAKFREGIRRYNAAHNVPEGPMQGYNETTTHAFLQILKATMDAYGEIFPTPDADAFCDTHPHLLQKHILRLFYTPERRMHRDAKAKFVAPDLAPLPECKG